MHGVVLHHMCPRDADHRRALRQYVRCPAHRRRNRGYASALFLILLAYTMSLATRLKAGGLVRQTILYKIIAFFGRGLAKLLHGILYLLRGIPLIGKTMLILILLTVVEFVFLITFWWEPNILLLFGFWKTDPNSLHSVDRFIYAQTSKVW